MDEPIFFATPEAFRAWLAEQCETHDELWVGFYKRGSGLPSMTWPEAVDEALCVGWIDAVRKSIDAQRYMIRFTRRQPKSIWSSVNIGRVADLIASGAMLPAGLRAFERRTEAKSNVYAYEQKDGAELEPAQELLFRENEAAWAFFQTQPAWYRRTAIWGIVSAKREETKLKRLTELIDDSASGRRIARLSRY